MKETEIEKNRRASMSKVFWLSLIVIAIGFLAVMIITADDANAGIKTQDLIAKDDTYIRNNYNYAQGGSTLLYMRDTRGSLKDRPMLKYDLTDLPDDAKISKAVFKPFRMYGSYSSNGQYDHTVSVYTINNPNDWKEGTSTANGATWSYWERSGSKSWNTAGGDYDSTAIGSKFISARDYYGANYQTQNFDVTELVQDWWAGTKTNNGFIMIMSGSSNYNSNYCYYASSEYSSPMYQSYLTVTYESKINWMDIAPSDDAYLRYNYDYGYTGTSSYLYARDKDGSYRDRPILKFDFSDLPEDAKVSSAEFGMYRMYGYTGSGNRHTMSLHSITNTYDWKEGSSAYTGVTWRYTNRATLSRWSTAGGDYNPTPIGSTYYSAPINYAWQTYDITTLAQGWIDGSVANNGVLYIMDGPNSNNYCYYGSRSYGSSPYVRVFYTSNIEIIEIQPGPSDGKDNYMYHYDRSSTQDRYNYGRNNYVYQYFYNYYTSWQYTYRGLLEFTSANWEALKGAKVESAELAIFYQYVYNNNGQPFWVDVHKIKIPWVEGNAMYGTPYGGSCWENSNYNTGTRWKGATGSSAYYDPTPIFSMQMRNGQTGWHKMDVKDLVADWIKNPDDNYGLLFKIRDETGSGYVYRTAYFWSSDYGQAKLRPKIVCKVTRGDQPPITVIDLPKTPGYYKTDTFTGWSAADGTYEILANDDIGLVETNYMIEDTSSDGVLVPWTKVLPDPGENELTIPLDMGAAPFNNREDTYSISYYSVDDFPHTEWTNTTEITIDTTPPGTPQVNFGTPYYENGGRTWITPGTTMEIDGATDYGGNGNPSGFTKGHGHWTNNAGSIWNEVDGQFKTSGEGDHQLWFRARDNVDNSDTANYVSHDLTIDGTSPATQTLQVGPVVNGFISYLAEWLIPGATDYCGGGGTPCGVERTEYSVDVPGGPYTTITLNEYFIINMMQGAHTIYYRSVDFMGNIESYRTLDVVVDNAPPPQSKLHYEDFEGPKWYDNDNLLIYIGADTEMELVAPTYDNPNTAGQNVGYDYSEYTFDGGQTWTQYTTTITIPKAVLEALGDGQFDFSFRSLDKLGNTYTTVLEMETIYYQGQKKYSFVLDNTAPVTEAMTPTTNDEGKGDWYEGSMYVTSEKKLYDSYMTYFKMGDSIDPLINNYGTGIKKVEWCVYPPSTDSEDMIWIDWEDYETVNRAMKEYETAMYLMGEDMEVTEGNWSIYYRAWDMLNNVEEIRQMDVTVDDSAPTSDYEILADGIALTGDELDYYAVGVDPNEFFADIDFEYKLSSYDLPGNMWMNAGLKMIEYKILDENTGIYIHSWKEYEGPFTLPGDGKFVIFYRGIDNLNHHENELSFTIYVDTVGPEQPDIEVGLPSYVDLTTYYLKVNTGVMKTPFKITNLRDPKPTKVTLASGIVRAEYKVDDGEWMDSFFDVFYPEGADEEHTIYARAIDKAGNVGEVQEKVVNTNDDLLYATVTFDSTAPTTEITKFTLTAGESGSVKLAWEVADKNFNHLNIYRSSIIVPGEWDFVDTVGNMVTKYTDIPDNDGSYRYKIAPADEVENEATGMISTENIILTSGRNREFQVPTDPGPYEPYVRVLMKTISTKATISAELLNTLPSGVDVPEGSDFTFWEINDGTSGGTRAALEAELYFYYGHLRLTSDMEDYMRVIYWDGHKWSDFAERDIDKTNDEIMVTTTHFSIYGVAKAYSDLDVDISMKSNPNLAGKQNVIYAEITNYGKAQGRLFDVDEEGANVTFAIRNADGGWTDLGYEVIDIMAGKTQTVSMVWDDAQVTGRDGVEVQVRVIPRDSKTENDPDNNFGTENVAVVESEFVVSSFVTSMMIVAISTIVVVALSRKIRKNK